MTLLARFLALCNRLHWRSQPIIARASRGTIRCPWNLESIVHTRTNTTRSSREVNHGLSF